MESVGQVKIRRYLVVAGEDYYPGRSNEDWRELYHSRKEAQKFARELLYTFDWVAVIDLATGAEIWPKG